ncbi:MAG: ATP-binding protein [Betaproteobacteria bacterium]|nr:ATP-binding protein [Betaproteobacteria bacterium]
MQASLYANLRRKIIVILAATAILPVLLLSTINYLEFRKTFATESHNPLRAMVSKSKNSLELFMAERSSTISLIASAFSYEDLADARTLQRIFFVMQKEFSGFVDLGLINEQGTLVNYVGPHKELLGIDYSGQEWFHKVRFQNRFVSEVFRGFRLFPHVIIAVQHVTETGDRWIVRATIDTAQFMKSMTVATFESDSDIFLLNRKGILQSDSLFYGKTLEQFPMPVPVQSYETRVINTHDHNNEPILLSYCYLEGSDFVLVAIKQDANPLQSWFMLRTDILLILCISILVIYVVAARTVGTLIARLEASDREREQAMLQMEHSQKLSSIGRLAAGVAHEINNPLAIINEKAGLLCDLLEMEKEFPRREHFDSNLKAISSAVTRCRDITHRMLGFARRMDVKIEELDVNAVLSETLLFLEKEAQHRSVAIIQELADGLPHIACDRGQLQQVFLNVLNNALAAVENGGETRIRSSLHGKDAIAISITDNGTGMDEETKKHIFEPFFTTKKEQGTGLGMSIIYGIVKRHGGEILVESEMGKGTTVTIILPVGHLPAGA